MTRGRRVSQAWAQQRCHEASSLVSHTDEVDLGVEEDQKKQKGKEGALSVLAADFVGVFSNAWGGEWYLASRGQLWQDFCVGMQIEVS